MPTVDPDDAFRLAFDREGFGFHFAVVRAIARLISECDLPWQVQQSEVPVTNRGREMRIDFVVRSDKLRAFIVAECKRVNPAFGSWCFAGSSYYAENRARPEVLLEQVSFRDGLTFSRTKPLGEHIPYPVAIQVKQRGEKGDPHGDTKSIEESVTQVLRGASGLVNLLHRHYFDSSAPQVAPKIPIIIVPVIFTTAKLFITDVDLALSDLATGRLPDAAAFNSKPFVWHQHHASESTRSELPLLRTMAELAELPRSPFKPEVFARSVAIVSAGGIQDFFNDLDARLPGTFTRFV